MDQRTDHDRRRFLALTSLGAAGLAGCSDLRDSNAQLDDQDADGPGAGSDTRSVAVIVQPDPTALREAQTDVATALEDGDLDQEEAERELAEREQELIDAAIGDASARIEQAGAVHVDTVAAEGTLLVEGEPGTLIDLLEERSISAVLSQSRFEAAQQRQGGQGDDDGADGELPEEDDLEDEDG